MRHRFHNLFPTPEFLSMPAVGFDISDQSIKWIELKETSSGLIVEKYGYERIPEGVVYAGKIQDPRRLSALISNMVEKNDFQFARISMPEEQVYLFTTLVPNIPNLNLREVIELQLEEHVPIAPIDSIFDFDIISESPTGILVDVSVVSRQLIESYLNTFNEAGFWPVSFELEASAISRSVVPKEDSGTYMIVDMGERRTGVSIVSNNIVHMATTLDMGGATLSEIVAKSFDLSYEEAENKKQKGGLMRSPENRELFSALLGPLSILRDEINKQYVYWHTHQNEEKKDRPRIEKLILCGGDSNLKGLPEYLSTSLRLPVAYANPWVNINSLDSYIPPLSFDESLAYTTAIGLALHDYLYE